MDPQQLQYTLKARELVTIDFYKNMEETNKLWHEALNLIITLSSSCLLITLALVDKLFPKTTNNELSHYIIFAWILFFAAIACALIQKLIDVIFQRTLTSEKAAIIEKIDQSLKANQFPNFQEMPGSGEYYKKNEFLFGAIAVDSFLLGILFLSLAFIENLFSCLIILIVLLTGVLLIAYLTLHLLKKTQSPSIPFRKGGGR
jgi:hypothetical protein